MPTEFLQKRLKSLCKQIVEKTTVLKKIEHCIKDHNHQTKGPYTMSKSLNMSAVIKITNTAYCTGSSMLMN
jgi:hypothetical protein